MRFYATLLRMGNFRLGISQKCSGVTLLIVGTAVLAFYLLYWTFLAFLWMLYGAYRLIAFIISSLKKEIPVKPKTQTTFPAEPEQENIPAFLQSNKVFWLSVFLFPPLAVFIVYLRDDIPMYRRILRGIIAFPSALIWILFIYAFFGI